MTRNQILYQQNVESNRHNVKTENQKDTELLETGRHNRSTERLGRDTLAETNRHNVADEAIRSGTLSETRRHNMVQEGYNYADLGETRRHNLANEDYQVRYGQASIAEQSRHNTVTEGQAVDKRLQDFVLATMNNDFKGAQSALDRMSQRDIAQLNALARAGGGLASSLSTMIRTLVK